METHGGIISTGENDSSTRALWQSYLQSSTSKAGETGGVNDEFGLQSNFIYTSKGSLTCCKIL
jgi:hypothetical protein